MTISRDIKCIRHDDINKDVAKDVEAMAELMFDAGESKATVFCITINTLSRKNGCFYVLYLDGRKVAYCVFTYGIEDKLRRVLQYFAVDCSMRGNGFGQQALAKLLETEVNALNGCTLACQSHLQSFYDKVGFSVFTPKNDTLSNRGRIAMTIGPYDDSDVQLFEVDEEQLTKNFPEIKRRYGVDLEKAHDID